MDFKKIVNKSTCKILVSAIKSFYYEVNRGRNCASHQLVCGYIVSRVLEVLHVAISKSGMDLLLEMQSVFGIHVHKYLQATPLKARILQPAPLNARILVSRRDSFVHIRSQPK